MHRLVPLRVSGFVSSLFASLVYITPQHYRPFWLYFIAFAVVIVGLITYFWHSTREQSLSQFCVVLSTSFASRRTGKAQPRFASLREETGCSAHARRYTSPQLTS